jgi:hypothetical protein
MKVLRDRIAREERTIGAMMYIYCRDHHALDGALCAQCGRLLVYARRRLATCPFQDAKPACNRCQVHCYSETMRERVKAVMRYAGPRMLLRHPILSLFHLLDNWREAPTTQRRIPLTADHRRPGARPVPYAIAEPSSMCDGSGRFVKSTTDSPS